MSTILKGILQELTPVLLSLIGGFIIFLLKALLSLVKNKLSESKLNFENQKIDTAIYYVSTLAEKLVLEMEQTAAKQLRELVKAGTVDKSKLETCGRQVLYDLNNLLSDEIRQSLSKITPNLTKYLQAEIEAQVLKMKQQNT